MNYVFSSTANPTEYVLLSSIQQTSGRAIHYHQFEDNQHNQKYKEYIETLLFHYYVRGKLLVRDYLRR